MSNETPEEDTLSPLVHRYKRCVLQLTPSERKDYSAAKKALVDELVARGYEPFQVSGLLYEFQQSAERETGKRAAT